MAIVRHDPFQQLTNWEPFREIGSLQREMNSLFDRLTPNFNRELSEFAFSPSAEITETDDEICLKLEVPGLEAKDLDIEVTEDAVAISGERQEETKSEEKGMKRSEFRYGKFERVIPLPARIQNDKVKAEYKNGVLNLTMSKSEEEKNKVIKVEVE